jgi:DNA-binding response OmpR family regulator
MIAMKKTLLALVMDVSPLTRSIISRAFNPADFEVLWTANLSGVEEASTRHHIDLLLLDLNQSLRTGRAIIERLTFLNRGTPVVILTEHKAAYDEALADQVGAVLQKPFSVAALAQSINTLLAKPSLDPAPATSQDAGLTHLTTSSDDLRDMLYQRSTAPYVLASPYRYWGINE